MTKIILEKYKYDDLIKLQEDFEGELHKSRIENEKWYEDELDSFKGDTIISRWIFIIISLGEFIYILIK